MTRKNSGTKIILLVDKTANKELLQELRKILSVCFRSCVEQYVLLPSDLPRIQSVGADLVITINLSGFEFSTLTGGISYNLWNTKFVHFLLNQNLPNEKYLNKPISISMFFYCLGKGYKEYLQQKYPEIPYLEEIVSWEKDPFRKSEMANAKEIAYLIYKIAGKCNLAFVPAPAYEAEFYFRQLKENQAETDTACQYIDTVLDEALSAQDASGLLSLIPYIESGKGNLAWQYVGETRRILRILHVIRLEIKYQMAPFFAGCQSKKELMERYLVVLFAIRRLAFYLSEESVAEAEQFLRSAGLSPFLLHIILQNELIPCDLKFYDKLSKLLENTWSKEEGLLFMRLAEGVGKG